MPSIEKDGHQWIRLVDHITLLQEANKAEKPIKFTLDYDFGIELPFSTKLGEVKTTTIQMAGNPLTFRTHTSKHEKVIQVDLLDWFRKKSLTKDNAMPKNPEDKWKRLSPVDFCDLKNYLEGKE